MGPELNPRRKTLAPWAFRIFVPSTRRNTGVMSDFGSPPLQLMEKHVKKRISSNGQNIFFIMKPLDPTFFSSCPFLLFTFEKIERVFVFQETPILRAFNFLIGYNFCILLLYQVSSENSRKA